LEEAIRDYNRAIQIDPGDAISYLNRGFVILLNGNRAGAEEDFVQCLRLAGDKRETFEKRIEKMKAAVGSNKNKNQPNTAGVKAGCH
jgi:tetratricopeptide (TPR) repeat protein